MTMMITPPPVILGLRNFQNTQCKAFLETSCRKDVAEKFDVQPQPKFIELELGLCYNRIHYVGLS